MTGTRSKMSVTWFLFVLEKLTLDLASHQAWGQGACSGNGPGNKGAAETAACSLFTVEHIMCLKETSWICYIFHPWVTLALHMYFQGWESSQPQDFPSCSWRVLYSKGSGTFQVWGVISLVALISPLLKLICCEPSLAEKDQPKWPHLFGLVTAKTLGTLGLFILGSMAC